ncbi:MAG: hypothetical protein CMN30_07945 [Sandaracinus sp.]|nr:hypothetical protein [Sandaracinus sp.]|tara:strand:- start:4190 stop:4882 length:693 start_codon:yes stop_codon:yes gene_type:complete
MGYELRDFGEAIAAWYEGLGRTDRASALRACNPFRDESLAVRLGKIETTADIEFGRFGKAVARDAFGNDFRFVSKGIGFWDHDEQRVRVVFATPSELVDALYVRAPEPPAAVDHFTTVLDGGDEVTREFLSRASDDEVNSFFSPRHLSSAVYLDNAVYILAAPRELLEQGLSQFSAPAILLAALHAKPRALEALLQRGVDTTAKDAMGRGLRFYAARTRPECRALLEPYL